MVASAVAAFFSPTAGEMLGPALVPPASVVAGVVGLREARRIDDYHQRIPWTLIATGFLAGSVGVAAFVVTSLFTEVGAFGPMDLPIFSGYGLIIVGLLTQPHIKESRSHQFRVLLDGAIGGISVATVFWVWFVGDVVAELSNAPLWDRIFGVTYPVLDLIAIAVVMIAFLRKSPQRADPRLLLVAAGFISQVVADLSWLVAGAGVSFQSTTPNYAPFLLAMSFFAAAALIAGDVPPGREYAERTRTPWWPMVAPYGWSAVMVAVLLGRARSAGLTPDTELLLTSTLFVGGLVVIRQFVAINENRHLVERERKALISTISHELRTPLTAMVGFLDVLNADSEVELSPEERGDLMQVVDQQARYLARIVSDLVLLARGSPSEMQLDRRPVDVNQVLQRAVTAMDTGMNDVRVVVPDGLMADVDGDRIQQALVNLLSNAIRYGGDERMVVAKVQGSDLTLEVHDNGPGVPKRYELQIWERFERGQNRLNATVPGSGIGLAIVAAIVDAHGGCTKCERSHLLGGACFSLTIPDSVANHRPQAEGEPSGRPNDATSPGHGPAVRAADS